MAKLEGKLINFETIYYSSNSIIYKAFNVETNEKVIIKTLNKELYDSKSLSKLKNEYELLKKLQGKYVVEAYEFLNMENHFSMVIEDFGGISLEQYISKNMIGIGEFLYIAQEIAKSLEYIHNRKVIHKDINPSNIVYNPNNKILKLIDFGMASEFSFETLQALNPNKLEGQLPYISPEQTGRMNRPLDYRTDFYSLGVTLYELACRRLPLVSEDPAEIIHFHIAKAPLPVYEINPDIPKSVSSIITKLMAKMPEERYQTARGILFDLETCVKQLENGRIDEFKLGEKDISGKFEVPKKLYGREYELKNLLASFKNVSEGKNEFILIGGYSGIGKTRLVNELHKPILKDHGIFISGKYDQYNRNTPYSACFNAIDQFFDYILSEPDLETLWKKRIIKALGSNGRLITEAVPRLALIIGEQPSLGELTPIEEQTRFKIALRNLITVIAAPEHPMVFFMDDVHWADMASLDLFQSLLFDENVKGLMFVGTYRDNEVSTFHPLIRTIENIEKNNGKVVWIKLENLNIQAVAQILSDTMNKPEDEILSLAAIIHERTQGNPFYTIEFLKHCNEEKLIYYNQNEMEWKWNEAGILNNRISNNVADYLISKIETLPEETKYLVKAASCIGNHFDIKVLSSIDRKKIDEIKVMLKPAIDEEMIYVSEQREKDYEIMQFEFCHDKFQQAGYQALSEDIKKTIHLNIARYYESNEDLEDKHLFTIAEHYSKALDRICNNELEKVIEIFFKAANAANLSSAYDTARKYLELIMDIAPNYLKKNDSFLLRIYTEYHLVLFSLARFVELDQIYKKIIELSEDPLDLVDCCCLQLISLSNRSRYEEGFLLGVEMLEKFGVNFPKDKLMEIVEIEYEKFYEYENNGSVEKIEAMDMLCDANGKAIAKLLNRIVPAAQFFDPLAAFWVTLINANLMLENGITPVALEISWGLFMGMIAYKNDFRCGNVLAEKSMQIVEREGFNAELYRMYHFNGLVRCHWFNTVEQDIYYAHEAYKGNLQNGEFEFSCYSFFTSITAILECCISLSEAQNEVEAALSFASKMGNVYGLESFVCFKQILKALKGETLTYGSFNDKYFDEEKHIEGVRHNAIGLAYYYIYRSLSAIIFGDYQKALNLTEKAIPLLPYIASFYTAALLRFLHSLSICKTINEIEDAEIKIKLVKVLEENKEWIYQRAKDAPINFQHLYDLIDAETKALAGNYDLAFVLYEKAIQGAKESKRAYHYALFCELAGIQYNNLGIKRVAALYLKEAYSAFLAWGATGKTEAMKGKYQYIIFSGIENAKLIDDSKINVLTNSIDLTVLTNSIDINAVVKATQAISGEIEKKKLLEKLMSIIIENSGSNRGYILIKDMNQWILSAFETINRVTRTIIDEQELLLENAGAKNALPISIIGYVLRTKEPVIIGDIRNSQFSTDDYFSENINSSVMCFPILSRSELKGIVLLQNDLLTEAFTKERLEVLNIFASQAAISLENSILYSDLEEKVKERTKQLEKTNISLKERTDQLAIAKEKVENAYRKLEKQNLQLQYEIKMRKQAEEEQADNLKQLSLSEERFYKIFHNSPVMMSIIRPNEERYIDVNSRWEEKTGYKREQVVNCSLTDLDLWLDTNYWDDKVNCEFKEKGVKRFERAIRTKCGEIRTFIISQTIVNINNENCWLSASIDITERKKMEQEMARLDRLNLVGEMAASIGHEIRNPMTTVRGYLQMVKQQENHIDVEGTFNLLIEELDRANTIITEFLSLARDKYVDLKRNNLNTIVAAIKPLLDANAMARDMNIKVNLNRVSDILLDEKEIRQLLFNISQNGLDAMSPGGTLFINTYMRNNEVFLSIRDEGHGIKQEILEKIGTPFFTTKDKGTGLGLSVCYGIAGRHGANIDIDTGKNGTTIWVRFPTISIENKELKEICNG